MQKEHGSEVESIKLQSENALNDIKYIYEQEKLAIENRLDKSKHNLKALELQTQDSGERPNLNLQEIQNNYLEEIQELNIHLDAFKKQSYDEIKSVKKQRDDALKRVSTMEIQLNKMKSHMRNNQNIHDQSSKTLKSKLEKAKMLLDASEGSNDHLKKLRKQNQQLKYSHPFINLNHSFLDVRFLNWRILNED